MMLLNHHHGTVLLFDEITVDLDILRLKFILYDVAKPVTI
jgi:ABC-type uncharacterized transport system ATPase subunit